MDTPKSAEKAPEIPKVLVTVLERFDLGGNTYAPGGARVPEDKVKKLLEKKLIATDDTLGDEAQLSGSTIESELLNALAPHIAEHGENEGAVDALYRIIDERDDLKTRLDNTNRAHLDHIDDLTRQHQVVLKGHLDRALSAEQTNRDLQSQIETLRASASGGQSDPAANATAPNASAQTPVSENGSGESQGQSQGQSETGTPVGAKELTPLVGAKGALSLVNAGLNTREKIAAATNEQLDDLDGIAEKGIEKLRAEFGAPEAE